MRGLNSNLDMHVNTCTIRPKSDLFLYLWDGDIKTIGPDKQKFEHKFVNIFSSISLNMFWVLKSTHNICFG